MSEARPEGEPGNGGVVELAALVRRVVGARVRDPHLVDDVVQETLARVMTARPRLQDGALAPYAVVTARNLVVSLAERETLVRRHAHRLVDHRDPPRPEEEVLQREESGAVGVALARLSARERDTLVSHELDGQDTRSLAAGLDSSSPSTGPSRRRAGAVRCCWLFRQVTGAGSVSWTPVDIFWSARCARR